MMGKVKRQKSKGKTTIQNLKFLSFSFVFCILSFTLVCYAEEITILYTGETHAMIYHCNCPVEPDGGIARRATLVKQIRKENPNTLLLDSGGFFAGGPLDEYSQNSQLDLNRTEAQLKGMELIRYDAVAIGDDEFNFGRKFLEDKISVSKIPFLSSNMESDKVKPYIIKDLGGVKIGIIGVTGTSAIKKAEGINFTAPVTAVQENVKDVKKKGADIVVLLSHLTENEDLNIIKGISGIDILIAGYAYDKKEDLFKQIGSTLLLRPSWQGRRLGKLSLKVQGKKIVEYNVDEIRLSDKVAEDGQVRDILPECFSDYNCKKEGFIGVCSEPGTIQSHCTFTPASQVRLLIINARDCGTCETDKTIRFLKSHFPGLTVSTLYYPDDKAKKIITEYGIKTLPGYLLGKEVEREKNFSRLKEIMDSRGDFYLIKPYATGIGYFLYRQIKKPSLDVFLSLYTNEASKILQVIRDFNPVIHFLAFMDGDGFNAEKGDVEIEEYLRGVCVEKYYPRQFLDYIACRADRLSSSWWEDCALNMDTQKIKECAKSNAGKELLKENIRLNQELQIFSGPAYLIDNYQIFGSHGAPGHDELKNVIDNIRKSEKIKIE